MSYSFFKKIDQEVFKSLDKAKNSPNYQSFIDFYTSLEDEQQKQFKFASLFVVFLIPTLLIGLLYWQNAGLRADYAKRLEIYNKANEILSKTQGISDVTSNILSQNPIDSSEIIISKVSNALNPLGVSLDKIQVTNFETTEISSTILSSHADFTFKDMNVNELMDTFIGLIKQEQFRIDSVHVLKNETTNLLNGSFYGIHYSLISQEVEE